MSRVVNRTPRHLDDPLKLGPFTIAQWVILVLAMLALWPLATWATFLPVTLRVIVGCGVIGLVVGSVGEGGGASLTQPLRRAWRRISTAPERLPGAPRQGPLTFALYDDEPHEEDPSDA